MGMTWWGHGNDVMGCGNDVVGCGNLALRLWRASIAIGMGPNTQNRWDTVSLTL